MSDQLDPEFASQPSEDGATPPHLTPLAPPPLDGGKWRMKSLQPKHKQVCSMLAQGIDRETIASVVGLTPEYISMLAAQPLVQQYMRQLTQIADLQLEGLYIKSVQAISDTLDGGSYHAKMEAARLQMEATKRIGSVSRDDGTIIDVNNRLVQLAEKLVNLQGHARAGTIIDVTPAEVNDGK